MREGSTLYCDELSAAEADVLLRLDEALDDRRQLVLKENVGEVIKAHPDWWVVATINPVTYAGVKELPAQMISRFPVRLYLKYPPPQVETQIVRLHVNEVVDTESLESAITLANKLRERAEVGDIPYSPTIRETIAFAKLLNQKMTPVSAATMVFTNVYQQWGEIEAQKVNDLIVSLFAVTKTTEE
jgi:nitric oxide reductase NorQ protein